MQSEDAGLFRIAAQSAMISAGVSAFGVLFLLLLYVGFFVDVEALLVFGPLNDLFIIIQYLLALPVVVALHRILNPQSARASLTAMLTAFVGIAGVVVFQVLLLTGVMDFEEQVLYASTFLLVVGIWVAITSTLGRRSGKLQVSIPVIILGALYVGYPIWVYRVGQRLRTLDPAVSEHMA